MKSTTWFATRTVNPYHIAGNPHADTPLMAYFPNERILVEADAYNPGATVVPFAPNLVEKIKKRNLRVDRIAPLFTVVGSYSDLLKAVQPTSSN